MTAVLRDLFRGVQLVIIDLTDEHGEIAAAADASETLLGIREAWSRSSGRACDHPPAPRVAGELVDEAIEILDRMSIGTISAQLT